MEKVLNNKKKIAFVGIGGVGGYYGGLVSHYAESRPEELEVSFVARGKNLAAIQQYGLKVSDEHQSFITRPALATDKVEEIGTVDYIVLATKSYDLDATMEQIKPMVSDSTIILPLLNGIDNTSRLRAFFPGNEVWYGCVYIITRLKSPGVIEDSGNVHFMHFGHEKKVSDDLFFIEQLFMNAGIEAVRKENPLEAIWRKFFFISTTAALTTYLNADFKSLVADADKQPLYVGIMKELLTIASAEGIKLHEGIIDDMLKYCGSLPVGSTASMNSDYLSGRRIEVDTLVGIVVKLGEQHEIPTPIYTKVNTALSAKR